nr:PfkB family carbohydrate kinase [Segetibacter sp. 3557_3]
MNYLPGGTGLYMSMALRNLNIRYLLVTAVAPGEQYIIDKLRTDGVEVISLPSTHTVYFENIYGENPDHRDQNVLNIADPFTVASLPDVSAGIFHLGPLLYQDFSEALFPVLASKGIISLDVQGLLRHVKNKKVSYTDWNSKEELLKHVTILKANEFELETLTGTSNVKEGAKYLAGLGVKEVVITLGSKGSLVYSDDLFVNIPAFPPTATIDTTGCGDTYMAGYLFKRINGASIEDSGIYGAAMATLKIQSFGPFTGSSADINEMVSSMYAFK